MNVDLNEPFCSSLHLNMKSVGWVQPATSWSPDAMPPLTVSVAGKLG